MKSVNVYVMGILMLLSQPFTSGALACDKAKHMISLEPQQEKTVKPDVAYVTLYIKTEGVLLSDAVEAANAKQKTVKQALREFSNVVESVSFVDVGLAFKSSYNTNQDPAPPSVVQQIQITAKPQTEKLYGIIDACIRKGASYQGSKQFVYYGSGRDLPTIVFARRDAAKILNQLDDSLLSSAHQRATELAAKSGARVLRLESASFYRTRKEHHIRQQTLRWFPNTHSVGSSTQIVFSKAASLRYSFQHRDQNAEKAEQENSNQKSQ